MATMPGKLIGAVELHWRAERDGGDVTEARGRAWLRAEAFFCPSIGGKGKASG